MSANIYHPSRGGVRGGKDQFNWEDVKEDKDRENYLGHSVKAPVGRWQKGKDLMWYTRDKMGNESAEERKRKEVESIKDLEAHAMAAALGYKVPPKIIPKKGDNIEENNDNVNSAAIREQQKKSKKKKEKSKKKRKKQKRKYDSSESEESDYQSKKTHRNRKRDHYEDDFLDSKTRKVKRKRGRSDDTSSHSRAESNMRESHDFRSHRYKRDSESSTHNKGQRGSKA